MRWFGQSNPEMLDNIRERAEEALTDILLNVSGEVSEQLLITS